jgi:hypothetical protein
MSSNWNAKTEEGDGMKIFQLFSFKIFNVSEVIGIARFETTGVMEDKAVNCGIRDTLLDVMLCRPTIG